METNQDIPEFLQSYVPENWSSGTKVKFETESDFDPNDVAGAGEGCGNEGGGWNADDNGQGDSGGGWGGSGGNEGAGTGEAVNASGGGWGADAAQPAAGAGW